MVSSENKNKNAFFNNFSCLQFHKTTFLKFTLVNKSCKPVSFSFSASSLQFSTGRSGSIVKLGIGYYLYFCLGGGGGVSPTPTLQFNDSFLMSLDHCNQLLGKHTIKFAKRCFTARVTVTALQHGTHTI